MRKPLALVVSILLNVLCVGYIGYSTLLANGTDEGGKMPGARVAPSQQASGDMDWQRVYDSARNAGLSELDAQYLLRGMIEAQRSAARPDLYWRPSRVREYESRDADRRFLQEARAALMRIIGQSATSSLALAALFRPLDPKASFLSSEKQIALEEMQYRALRQSAQRSTTIGPMQAGGTGFFSTALLEQAQPLLSADELLELEMRLSPIAARLANVAPDLSEAQFREAYGLLRAAPQSGSSGERLRELLGEARLAALNRAASPTELALANVIRKHGISPGEAAKAMEVIRTTRSAAALSGAKALEPASASELRRLIGEDAYADYVAAMSKLARAAGG